MPLDAEHGVVRLHGEAHQVVAEGVALLDPGLGEGGHCERAQDRRGRRLAEDLAELAGPAVHGVNLRRAVSLGRDERHPERRLQAQLAAVAVAARRPCPRRARPRWSRPIASRFAPTCWATSAARW